MNRNAEDAWKHLFAILRLATRSKSGTLLFLPVRALRIENKEGGLKYEDSYSETGLWLELWLTRRLSPWLQKTEGEIVEAAIRGEFRHLGNECRCDLLNGINRAANQDRVDDRVTIDDVEPWYPDRRTNLFDIESDFVRKEFDAELYYRLSTREKVGDLAPGLRARLKTYMRGDETVQAVLEETARELEAGPERARKYDHWFRKHVVSARPFNAVLQSIHSDLARPEPKTPLRPAIRKAIALSEEDFEDES